MHNQLHFLDDSLCTSIELLPETDHEHRKLFASGLLWCYGFHHEQAHRHFTQLVQAAPQCALGYWGLAYSCAPFYNRPWSWFTNAQQTRNAEHGFNTIKQGLALFRDDQDSKTEDRNHRSLVFQLLSNLALLFRQPKPVDSATFQSWQVEYADAMLTLTDAYGKQPDIATLIVESLLNCTPWQLWNIRNGDPTEYSRVNDAIMLLESALNHSESNRSHVGLLHMHIHALEMSPEPQRASRSASQLRQLCTSMEAIPPHLPHMATHIDMLTGQYRDAIETNIRAVCLDQTIPFDANEFYLISRLHNMHLQLTAAMMAGRRSEATQARRNIENLVNESNSRMHDEWLRLSIEGFYANRLHTHIRFGEWDLLTTESLNKRKTEFSTMPFAQAMTVYARSVAHANVDNLNAAEQGLVQLEKQYNDVPDWYVINNNPARRILAVALAMLEGEWRYHAGDVNGGLDKLRNAVVVCDELDYCEPWPWMHPPRHALGALLLEQKKLDEATVVYETDLGLNDKLPRCLQHPLNLWSLTGLAECYNTLGNKNGSENIANALSLASGYADIKIQSSCYCRKSL